MEPRISVLMCGTISVVDHSTPARTQTEPAHRDGHAVLQTTTRTGHSVRALIASWLGSFTASAATRAAYQRDLGEYVDWCARRGLDPLRVRLPEVQIYATELAVTPNPRTGRPCAASTSARKLAAISSWYTFLVRSDAVDANPARDVARPRYDRRHSPTASVTAGQAATMLSVSREQPHRTLGSTCAAAVMTLLVDLGVRVSEVCRANIGDLGQREGMPVLTVRMKGGAVRVRPIPPRLSSLLRQHLSERAGSRDDDALLVTEQGRRLNRHQVYRLVQRAAAQAGVPMPERITPHSMRHTFNTIARERGAPLEDRRDALGHSSAAITQLYDHLALSVSRDPAHLVAAATAGEDDG